MRPAPRLLIVFGGLPGTGKTTISRALARRLLATHLRIDVIEQAMEHSGISAAMQGAAGYAIAGALAAAHLADGARVVIDAVNPVAESRAGWRDIAGAARAVLIEIELICSDPSVHRARLEGRTIDIPGLANPSWRDVVTRHYAPWVEPHPIIDTAHVTQQEAIEAVVALVGAAGFEPTTPSPPD